jgi:hypothetical protein
MLELKENTEYRKILRDYRKDSVKRGFKSSRKVQASQAIKFGKPSIGYDYIKSKQYRAKGKKLA